MNRSIISIALAVGLLAGSTAGVAAQDEVTNDAAAVFRATTRSPADIRFDPETGISSRLGIPVEATDPRVSGLLSFATADGGVCSEFGRTIGLVDCGLPVQQVSRSAVQLVNDDGSWVGTRIKWEASELDERTKKQKRNQNAKGTGPINDLGSIMELTGTGAYDGLSIVATLSRKVIVGVIVPTATLPTQPALPVAEETVVEEPVVEEPVVEVPVAEETAPAETAPAETAPAETAPAETAAA